MTTGRINQVTIFDANTAPDGDGGGPAPRREQISCRLGRERIHTRSQTARSTGGAAPGTIRLPPLSSPGSGPRRRDTRPVRDGETAVYTPRKKDTPPRSRRRDRRIPGGAYPLTSGDIFSQRPLIHRPQHRRRA